MPLSGASVSRPITTLMVFMAIVAMGLVAYTRIPTQLLPDIDFPTIVVVANNDKSAEENLETVAKVLEGDIAQMPRVKSIRSSIHSGAVRIRIDFEFDVDLQYATVDLQDRLDRFRRSQNDRRLFLTAFPFSTSDFQASYMFLSVRSDTGNLEAFEELAENVEQQLRSISGVANVSLRGLYNEVIEVEFATDRLSSFGLELGAVMAKVQAAASDNNYLGRYQTSQETYFVRLDDRVRTAEQLANVTVDNNGIVKLSDVAFITQGPAVNQYVSRSNGKSAISIQMEREAGKNMIELARTTRTRIAEINERLPVGTELVIVEDLAKYVEDAISTVTRLALQGAFLALMIPMLFFRSLRLSLVVFASVPISLIAVFNLFYATSMSINIFSIVGLALGVGMLVDSSIVVSENAVRLYEKGMSATDAAREGGAQVGRGLIAATLTSAIVFLPLVFLDGEFKVIVKEPTLALVFPLLLSLLVALTLVPVLVSVVLRLKKRTGKKSKKRFLGNRIYTPILRGSLRNRGLVLFIVATVLCFTWLESCDRIRESTTSQESNSDWMAFYFQANSGATLSDVNMSARAIESRLADHPNILQYTVSFNREGGSAELRLKPRKERQRGESFEEVYRSMVDYVGEIPGVEVSLRRFNRPEESVPLNLGEEGIIELKGIDRNVLDVFAARLVEALRTYPKINGASIREDREDPLYIAAIDRDRTRLFDIQSSAIVRYIGATAAGGTLSSLRLIDGDKRTDVSFFIPEASGGTLEDVRSLVLRSPTAGSVPLGEVTRFQTASAPSRLRRTDRQASLEVSYFAAKGESASALREDVRKIFASIPNPSGVVLEFQGEAQRLDDRQQQFGFILLSGAIFVYIVMAAVFESFWVPFVILLTNPLMLIGIVWGLDIMGLPFDDLAAFGVILLVGLAVNNGIVLMDRALDLQRRGVRRTRAIYEACMTRLRPILMTYFTTVLGLLPMALVGEENDQWRPVAVVVIGGLTSATLLTLIVLPCFYIIGDDFMRVARAPFLRALGYVFTTMESFSNAILHPIRSLIQLPRRIKSAIVWIFRTLRRLIILVYTMLRFLWQAPGDLLSLFQHPKARSSSIPMNQGALPLAETTVIELTNVNVRYGKNRNFLKLFTTTEFAALTSVNLDMERGIVGLLGPNGAGKTTLMRCLAGIQRPTRGNIRLLGEHVYPGASVNLLIDYLPQTKGVGERESLRESLRQTILARLIACQRVSRHRAVSETVREFASRYLILEDAAFREKLIEESAEEVGLLEVLDRPLRSYSGGMKQRAGIARLLVGRAPILLVDEPTASLDPEERIRIRLLLARLAEGRLILISTHLVEDLEAVCSHLLMMTRGRIIFSGTPDEARARVAGRVVEVANDQAPSGIALGRRWSAGRELIRVYTELPDGNSNVVPPTLEDAFLALEKKSVG